jgi:hypothetical protein
MTCSFYASSLSTLLQSKYPLNMSSSQLIHMCNPVFALASLFLQKVEEMVGIERQEERGVYS